jgi:hypothetical protein
MNGVNSPWSFEILLCGNFNKTHDMHILAHMQDGKLIKMKGYWPTAWYGGNPSQN